MRETYNLAQDHYKSNFTSYCDPIIVKYNQSKPKGTISSFISLLLFWTCPPPLACNEPIAIILLLSLDIMTRGVEGNTLWLMKSVLLVDKEKSDE